jgi:hypothetical protein
MWRLLVVAQLRRHLGCSQVGLSVSDEMDIGDLYETASGITQLKQSSCHAMALWLVADQGIRGEPTLYQWSLPHDFARLLSVSYSR